MPWFGGQVPADSTKVLELQGLGAQSGNGMEKQCARQAGQQAVMWRSKAAGLEWCSAHHFQVLLRRGWAWHVQAGWHLIQSTCLSLAQQQLCLPAWSTMLLRLPAGLCPACWTTPLPASLSLHSTTDLGWQGEGMGTVSCISFKIIWWH